MGVARQAFHNILPVSRRFIPFTSVPWHCILPRHPNSPCKSCRPLSDTLNRFFARFLISKFCTNFSSICSYIVIPISQNQAHNFSRCHWKAFPGFPVGYSLVMAGRGSGKVLGRERWVPDQGSTLRLVPTDLGKDRHSCLSPKCCLPRPHSVTIKTLRPYQADTQTLECRGPHVRRNTLDWPDAPG